MDMLHNIPYQIYTSYLTFLQLYASLVKFDRSTLRST